MLHQQHVLFGFMILAAYAWLFRTNSEQAARRRVMRGLMLYGVSSVPIVLVSYALAATLVHGARGWQRIILWSMGSTFGGRWGHWTLAAPLQALVGLMRAIVGGHFLFALETFQSFITLLAPHHMLREEMFLMRNASALRTSILLALSLALGSTVVVLVGRLLRRSARVAIVHGVTASSPLRFVLLLCGSYIITYGVFNIWWEPLNSEFWISLLPFAILALSVMSAVLLVDRTVRLALCSMSVLLFTVNLVGSVLPQTTHENDYWYVFNRWLIEHASADDVIVTGAGYIPDAYLRYYSGAFVLTTWWQHTHLDKRFAQELDRLSPQRVLFSSTVDDPPGELYTRFSLDRTIGKEFFDRHRHFLSLIHEDEWQRIYLYLPPARTP